MKRPYFIGAGFKQILFMLLLASSTFQVRAQVDQEATVDAEVYYLWDLERSEWVLDFRGEYTYDSLGRAIEERSYSWDVELLSWNGVRRFEYGYDSLGSISSQYIFSWDDQSASWLPGGSICDDRGQCFELPGFVTVDLDTTGELNGRELYFWDKGGQQYFVYSRYFKVYDEQGREVEITEMELDTVRDTWDTLYQQVLFYDSLGNNSSLDAFVWDAELQEQVASSRRLFSYDSLGMPVEELSLEWDRAEEAWVQTNLYNRAFDTLGNEVMYAVFDWDAELPGWRLSMRQEYSRDSLGKTIEYIDYLEDQETGVESPNWRIVYTYDASGNQLEEIGYYWNPRIAYWSRTRRETMSYDTTGTATSLKSYNWDNNSNDWMLDWGMEVDLIYTAEGEVLEETLRSWDAQNKEWINESRMEYYWSNDLLRDQIYFADESNPDSSTLGSIVIGRLYLEEEVVLALGLNGADGLFAIDSLARGYTVLQRVPLDFEQKQEHSFSVIARVEKEGGTETDSAVFTIYVRNVNDNAPLVRDTTFYVEEGLVWTKSLGKIYASDADGDLNPLEYSISAGDDQNIFRFSNSAYLIIKEYELIDYEQQDVHQLTVRVSDGLFYGEAPVTVYVLDVEEATSLDQAAHEQIRIYPNPASDVLRLEGPAMHYEVVISALSGTLLHRSEFSGSTCELDISAFSKGVYLVSLRSEEGVVTRKIIRQ